MVELVAKSSWVGDDGSVFKSIFFADSLGFGAALLAKLAHEILFMKVVSYLN